jgi:hypothetical protein
MVDLRVMNGDGIRLPSTARVWDFFEKNDFKAAWSTRFAANLAKSSGWTKGYAHFGIKGLANKKRLVKATEPGEMNMAGFEVFHRQVAKESGTAGDLKGVPFTKEEETKVLSFHKTEIERQIRHYPIPMIFAR